VINLLREPRLKRFRGPSPFSAQSDLFSISTLVELSDAVGRSFIISGATRGLASAMTGTSKIYLDWLAITARLEAKARNL
jgi:hypothetical protein